MRISKKQHEDILEAGFKVNLRKSAFAKREYQRPEGGRTSTLITLTRSGSLCVVKPQSVIKTYYDFRTFRSEILNNAL